MTSLRLLPRAALLAIFLALGATALIPSAAGAATRSGRCAHRASYKQGSGTGGTSRPRCGRRRHRHAPHAGASCRHTNLRPNAANLDLIRGAVLCLIDRERARHGERALRPNMRLRRAAQGHSESMARGAYFAHVGPGGLTPLARMRAVGYISRRTRGYEVGENIAFGTLWLASPRAIVAAWMASPGHRANILDGRFRDTAIGVSPHVAGTLSHGQAGAVYTQDFGVRLGR
ncbi:MAG TPA: CAP domain-containing protein [Solirubrobacteraceae bacterium]|nr:CAP domain-containing protein [Solirubrobacteraceae bacterium]